ncbi:MAG: hypothetical protein ACOC44_03640 [Promethearchaeia archaeon]
MVRGVKELGNTQKCPKCDDYGKMIALKVSKKDVIAKYLCSDCMENFEEKYSIEEFVKMGNMYLLDEKWIKDFQRKYMIAAGKFIQIEDGLDGAYFSKNKKAVRKYGSDLICDCGEFYHMKFRNHKKSKLYFRLRCEECGTEKFKIKEDDFFELGKAGIIPTALVSEVKDIIEMDDLDWDSTSSYSTPSTVLSTDARSRLGMEEDETLEELESLTCPKCGAAISMEMKKFGKCGTCGADLTDLE